MRGDVRKAYEQQMKGVLTSDYQHQLNKLRDHAPLRHRLLCMIGVHRPMDEAVNAGASGGLGPVFRFECSCGKKAWLENELEVIEWPNP